MTREQILERALRAALRCVNGNIYSTDQQTGETFSNIISEALSTAPTEQRTEDELGWLLERNNAQYYFAGMQEQHNGMGFCWFAFETKNHLEAMRFARKEDANKMAEQIKGHIRYSVVQHLWMANRKENPVADTPESLRELAQMLDNVHIANNEMGDTAIVAKSVAALRAYAAHMEADGKDAVRYRTLRALSEPDETGGRSPKQWKVVAQERGSGRLLFDIDLDKALDDAAMQADAKEKTT